MLIPVLRQLCVSRTAEVKEAKDTIVKEFLAEFGSHADKNTGDFSTAARKQDGKSRSYCIN